MRTFAVEILTPDGGPPAAEAYLLDVPAVDGRLTVLAGHAPLVCRVEAGLAALVLPPAAGGDAEAGAYREARWRLGAGTLVVAGERATLLVANAEAAPAIAAGALPILR